MSENKKLMKLIDTLNSLNFDGCEGVACGDVLYYHLMDGKKSCEFPLYKSLLRVIFFVFTYENKYVESGSSDNLLLFSNSYRDRKDLLSNFFKFEKLINNKLVMLPDKRRFTFDKIKDIYLLFKWNVMLKPIIVNPKIRWLILMRLYQAYSDYKEYDNYIHKKQLQIKNMISFCDVHAIDSFFTQKFNYENKNTVTLQHGTFCSSTNAWAIEASRSHFFFANSQFTLDEAHYTKYRKENKMIPVGLLSAIGELQRPFSVVNDINVIGVLLDGELQKEDNIRTLKTMQEYCRKNNKKLVIKFHPSSNNADYKCYMDECIKYEFVTKDVSIFQFSEVVDITITRNSTTLIEMLQLGRPVLRIYSENQAWDVYKNSKTLKFETVEELENLLDSRYRDMLQKTCLEMKKYFCGDGDISKNYKRALERLEID